MYKLILWLIHRLKLEDRVMLYLIGNRNVITNQTFEDKEIYLGTCVMYNTVITNCVVKGIRNNATSDDSDFRLS